MLGAVEVTLTAPGEDGQTSLKRRTGSAAPAPQDAALDAVLRGPDGRLGVLSARTTHPTSAADAQFLQAVANVLAGAVLRDGRHRAAVTEAMHRDKRRG